MRRDRARCGLESRSSVGFVRLYMYTKFYDRLFNFIYCLYTVVWHGRSSCTGHGSAHIADAGTLRHHPFCFSHPRSAASAEGASAAALAPSPPAAQLGLLASLAL